MSQNQGAVYKPTLPQETCIMHTRALSRLSPPENGGDWDFFGGIPPQKKIHMGRGGIIPPFFWKIGGGDFFPDDLNMGQI